MVSLPVPEQLSGQQQREMIARYTAVLEGNFIYWMTAAYLAVQSEEARPIIIDNLLEEIRDSHPVMLRNFAIAVEGNHIDLALDRLFRNHDFEIANQGGIDDEV